MDKKTQSTLFSSRAKDWETPNWLFNELNKKYKFVCDLAADHTNCKCEWMITKEENSLLVSWDKIHKGEWLWLNPPYGRDLFSWVMKCHDSAQRGAKIVALLPARTDTKWFHYFIYNKYKIKFIKGRLKFLLNGIEQSSAPFPSMLVYFKKHPKRLWLRPFINIINRYGKK